MAKPDPENTHQDTGISGLIRTIVKTCTVRLHPAGMPFVAGLFVLSVLLMIFWVGGGLLGLILTGSVWLFFRDPIRHVPQGDGLVIAPADGKVTAIKANCPLPPELEKFDDMAKGGLTRISIFLSVLDVHVNRVPVSGKVEQICYIPGKFLNAELDKASTDNERSLTHIRTADGKDFACVQIAGLVARRIINDLVEGGEVRAGERMGLIRFGSRMDVYLPDGVVPLVAVGQTMIGGETVLADAKSAGTPRTSQAT